MHPKIKPRPSGGDPTLPSVKPPLVHDVSNVQASAKAASRSHPLAPPSPVKPTSHALHHVSLKKQS